MMRQWERLTSEDAIEHTSAADTKKLRKVWVVEANRVFGGGFSRAHAINMANAEVNKTIRQRRK